MSDRSEDVTFTQSSGNVFADLGVSQPEEAYLKSALTYQISKIIEQRHLTQAQAAEVLSVDQPKISALKHGRLSGFSVDRLLKFVLALNYDVDVRVLPKAGTAARITVSEVPVRISEATTI